MTLVPLFRSAGLTDAVVYGVQIPGCEGRIGMAAIAEDIGNYTIHNLEQLLMTCGYSYAQISGGDPNSLNLDPDPGFWHNLDQKPDPGLCINFEKICLKSFGGKISIKKIFFLKQHENNGTERNF